MTQEEEKRGEIDRLVDVLVCAAMSSDKRGCSKEIFKVKESVTRALYRIAGADA
jgi:hypothetical protein